MATGRKVATLPLHNISLFLGRKAPLWVGAERKGAHLVDYISLVAPGSTVCAYLTDAPIGGSCRTKIDKARLFRWWTTSDTDQVELDS
jgi:hypothetical protein